MSNQPLPQTVSALLIVATIFHALAVIVTSFRLWYRYHIRRLWWDDFCAALALLFDIVCMVAQWTLTAPSDDPVYFTYEALPTPALSRKAHIISWWLNILFYTFSIWFARVSIVCSLVRIVPPSRSVNVTTLIAGIIFVCMCIYMLVAKTTVCAVDESWYRDFVIVCPIPKWVAISEVCSDALSDAILVALPIRLLWHVKLPSKERILVLSVFSTSILVSIISAVHTAYLLSNGFLAGATAEMEGAVSLIVCNLLVVVSFIYRTWKTDSDPTRAAGGAKAAHHWLDDGKRQPFSSNKLTTVDLEFTAGSVMTSADAYTSTASTAGFASSTASGTAAGTGTEVSSVVFASMGDHPKETSVGSVGQSSSSSSSSSPPSSPARIHLSSLPREGSLLSPPPAILTVSRERSGSVSSLPMVTKR